MLFFRSYYRVINNFKRGKALSSSLKLWPFLALGIVRVHIWFGLRGGGGFFCRFVFACCALQLHKKNLNSINNSLNVRRIERESALWFFEQIAHFLWAKECPITLRSVPLFKERRERIAYGCSFVKSDGNSLLTVALM